MCISFIIYIYLYLHIYLYLCIHAFKGLRLTAGHRPKKNKGEGRWKSREEWWIDAGICGKYFGQMRNLGPSELASFTTYEYIYTLNLYMTLYIYTYMIHISWGSPGGRECFLYKSISGTRCGRSSLLPRKAECCLFHPACSYFVLYHLVLDDGFYRPRISSWFESTAPIPNVDYPAASPSDSFVLVKDLFPCG